MLTPRNFSFLRAKARLGQAYLKRSLHKPSYYQCSHLQKSRSIPISLAAIICLEIMHPKKLTQEGTSFLNTVCISQENNSQSWVCTRTAWDKLFFVALQYQQLTVISSALIPLHLHYTVWLFSPLPSTTRLSCFSRFIVKLILLRTPAHTKDHVRIAHLQPEFSV